MINIRTDQNASSSTDSSCSTRTSNNHQRTVPKEGGWSITSYLAQISPESLQGAIKRTNTAQATPLLGSKCPNGHNAYLALCNVCNGYTCQEKQCQYVFEPYDDQSEEKTVGETKVGEHRSCPK